MGTQVTKIAGRLAAAVLSTTALTAVPAFAQTVEPPKKSNFRPLPPPPSVTTPTEQSPLNPQAGTLLANGGMIRALMQDVAPFWSNTPVANPTVLPTVERLAPFWGTITPYAGMIRALEGDLSAQAGMIRALEGPVDEQGGMIRAVSGTIDPYAGMIRAVEGDISTQAGMIRAVSGDVASMAGLIQAHVGDLGATAGMIRAVDTVSAGGTTDYASTLRLYRTFVDKSELFWNPAVVASTGKRFSQVVAAPLLAKYGIDLNDAASIAKLSADQREMFFLDWYDNIMQFSGADQVDHWMKAIGWTPKLTQQQGSGSRAVIGLIDFFVANDPDIASKVIYSGGYTAFTGHGAGVASLILASHDGKGVMGIAPNARVAAYNPFDATYSASWADVTKGIAAVTKAGAGVVNLSLGVPGYTLHPEWRTVFKSPGVDTMKDKTLYIIAAGNSGTVQTANVNMEGALDSTFLVVGSVSSTGKISEFSNQPGLACVTKGTECKFALPAGGLLKTGDTFLKSDYLKESGLLMNRFLVAPGEMILVADGLGGVTRMSGTSFAAPLVAGAVALIQDRWPWLKNYPRDVAKILLDSATDLGEKGADPVYGRGMLNIEAAQNVLDFDKLRYYLWTGATKTELKVPTLRTTGFQSVWADKDMYFTAFEQLPSSERDFLIPLSSRLFGTMKNGQYFQEFVYNHFVNWLATGTGFSSSLRPKFGFSDISNTALTSGDGWSTSVAGRMQVSGRVDGSVGQPKLLTSVTVNAPANAFRFTVGSGDGALNLAGQYGLRTSSDFAPYSGGSNPLLGFASGGAHVSSTVALSDGIELTAGMTKRKQSTAQVLDGIHDQRERMLLDGAHRYAATAYTMRLDYRPVQWLGLSTSATRLEEARAFLGVRSLADSDFGRGSTTDGVTVQADVDLGDRTTFFGSATGARSSSPDRDAAFRIGGGGLIASAFQVGVARSDLIGRGDRLRLSVSQPLNVERGTVEFSQVVVIDRETGEKGVVTETFDITQSGKRRAIAELQYGAPVLGGRGELNVFGRGELRKTAEQTAGVIVGGQARFAF